MHARLSDDTRALILALHHEGNMTRQEIADVAGVADTTVYRTVGLTRRMLTPELRSEIIAMADDGVEQKTIAEWCNFSRTAINRVVNGARPNRIGPRPPYVPAAERRRLRTTAACAYCGKVGTDEMFGQPTWWLNGIPHCVECGAVAGEAMGLVAAEED